MNLPVSQLCHLSQSAHCTNSVSYLNLNHQKSNVGYHIYYNWVGIVMSVKPVKNYCIIMVETMIGIVSCCKTVNYTICAKSKSLSRSSG